MFNPLIAEEVDTEKLRDYIISRDTELESDVSDRKFGKISSYAEDSYVYAGYDKLRDFFDGDQWVFKKESGGNQRVYNYCRTTVLNYQAFLSNEPPEFDVPPVDINDDYDVQLAEEKERLLKEILDDNKFALIFSEACQNQSLTGDAMIFCPYIEEKDGEKRIRVQNIKRPENIRIFWRDESYIEMEGFTYHWRISTASAEKIFAKELEEKKIVLSKSFPRNYKSETEYPMTTIIQYWDERNMMFLIGDNILKFVEHNWGFIPLEYIKNIPHPTKAWGISDIEDMLDAQVEYNEAAGDVRDIIKQDAIPHIFTSGVGEAFGEYKAGKTQIIDLGAEGKVYPDPRNPKTAPVELYMNDRKSDLHGLSMVSEIIYGGPRVREATGRALSILLQGINNKVKMKQTYWDVSLKSMVANIFRLVERYWDDGKKIVQGRYNIDIFFPSVLIRDTTEEINKFLQKLQSQYTTMKNLGVPSPKDEVKKMKSEWNDVDLSIELSRQPALRMEIQKMMAGAGAEQQPSNQQPGLQPYENMGEQPMSATGVPVMTPRTPEGAVEEQGVISNEKASKKI